MKLLNQVVARLKSFFELRPLTEPPDNLSWKSFFALQPLLLFYSYLVGCFLHATLRSPDYGSEYFPLDRPWLIFGVPTAAILGLIIYLLIRKFVSTARAIILLFCLVPFGSALPVQIFFATVFSLPLPPG